MSYCLICLIYIILYHHFHVFLSVSVLCVCSEKCKARGFTVIVDGRRSQWNVVKTVVLMLQVGRDKHFYTYTHLYSLYTASASHQRKLVSIVISRKELIVL